MRIFRWINGTINKRLKRKEEEEISNNISVKQIKDKWDKIVYYALTT